MIQMTIKLYYAKMSTEDCSYSETRNNRMKKSIEKITYCFVIIAALFVSFVSFVEPLVMKDINITKVILVLLCYAAVFAGSLTPVSYTHLAGNGF